MSGTWLTKAIIAFESNGSRVLGSLLARTTELAAALERVDGLARTVPGSFAGMNTSVSSSSRLFGTQTTRLNAAAAALERYNLAVRESRGAPVPIIGGGGGGGSRKPASEKDERGGGFGVGGAAGVIAGLSLIGGIHNAAKTQSAIANLAIQMGRSPQWTTQNFLPLAMRISDMTARSVPDEVALFGMLSTFIKDPKALKKIAPTTALLADTLYLGPQHLDFTQTASQFGRIAHQLNTYKDPKALALVADQYYRIATSSPDKANTLVTQLGYFGHSFRGAGVSAQDTLNMLLWGDLAIGRGKYGAGLGRVLSDLADPSQHNYRGQIALGLRDAKGKLIPGIAVDAKGNFTPLQMMRWLADHEKGRSGLDRTSDISQAFNVNAARTLSNMTSRQSLQFYDSFTAALKRMPPLQSAQATLLGTLNGQTARLTSNFATLTSTIGTPFVNPLGGLFHRIGDAESWLAQFFAGHKTAARTTGEVAALAGIRGAIAAYQTFFGGHGLLNVSSALHRLAGDVARLGSGAEKTAAVATEAASGFTKIAAPLSAVVGILSRFAPFMRWLPSVAFAGQQNQFPPVSQQILDEMLGKHTPYRPGGLNLPSPLRPGPMNAKLEVHGVVININGAQDPKATGEAVVNALHPMSILRSAGSTRSTAALPFAFSLNGVR